jgi:hypothetical protein
MKRTSKNRQGSAITNIDLARDRILEDMRVVFPGTELTYLSQGKGAVVLKAGGTRPFALRVTNLQTVGRVSTRAELAKRVVAPGGNVINGDTLQVSRATGDSTVDVDIAGWAVVTKNKAWSFASKTGKGGRRLDSAVAAVPDDVLEGRKRIYGFMQMELIDGVDLSDVDRDGAKLPADARAKLRQTLKTFWAAGFEHGDLIAANIMWVPKQERFVLIDLDTACPVKRIQTRSRSMKHGESEGRYLARTRHRDKLFYKMSVGSRIPDLFLSDDEGPAWARATRRSAAISRARSMSS